MTLLIQSLTVTLIVPAITLIATFINSFAGRRVTVPYFLSRGDHWSPLNSYFTYHPSVVSRQPPSSKKPLLEERWHAVAEWWLSWHRSIVLSLYWRPMTATTNMLWHHTYFLRRGDYWSPLNSYFTYHPSVVSRQLPSRGAIVVAATHHFA